MTKPSACPPLDTLVDLACRDGVEIRPILLRVLTDLYVQKQSHSADEEAQYVELSLRLIEAVDAPTRSAVATRLSTYPNAPVAVLRRLLELAAEAGAASAPAIAPAAKHDLAGEFFAANANDRRLILTSLEAVGLPVPRRAAPAVSEVIRRLETAALQRNPGEFARMLERALGISHWIAERVTRDNSGEPLMVAAKVLGMPAAVFQRVLMFLNPSVGQSVERVFELSRLYDEIQPAAAERMVAIWREASAARRPNHTPAYWDDKQRSARAAAAPTARTVAPRRAQPISRFKNSD
jgi:Uncharacterised protein conserved in bacteria (DUF2336)